MGKLLPVSTILLRIIVWTTATIIGIYLGMVVALVYFPALAHLDWGFVRVVSGPLAVLAYGVCWGVTGRTPWYWLAKISIKLEAHQQQAAVIVQEAVEEYRQRRPQMEAMVKREIGG